MEIRKQRKRIKKEILKGSYEFTETDVETMKYALETFLSLLNNDGTEIPNYWKEKYGPNLENATIEQMRENLWNPDLFPKIIKIDDEDNVVWKYPS